MNSKIFSLALIAVLTISLSAASGQYWTFVKATSTTDYVCGDHVCHPNESPIFWKYYQQWQSFKLAHKGKLQLVHVPQSIEIFAPDGICDINGTINPDGSCTTPSMVVSAATYNNLTMDPAIMALPPQDIQPTQAAPTTTFCQIANWIILNEDGYFSNIANETALVDPPYCNGPVTPVPEFGNLATMMMGIAIIVGISVTALVNKRKL